MDESSFRKRLHEALGDADLPPHVGDQTRRALRDASASKPNPARFAGAIAALLAIAIVAGLVGVNALRRSQTPVVLPLPAASSSATAPPTAQGHLLVFTTWAPDSKVGDGPEPGYRPLLTGLTGHDIQSISAGLSDIGVCCVLNIKFTPRGTDIFKALTRNNVAACGGAPAPGAYAVDCAQRHLAVWVDLTQADLDHWEDPAYVSSISQLFDLTCLARTSSTTVCPKFVSDPVTIAEIDSGNATISGDFTQQSANDLVNAINAESHS